jgi:phosphoribosyl 1,2-cyclic phosphodiesterase
MRVVFWGGRGSLPVALNAAAVTDKIVAALLAAEGRRFAGPQEARRFALEQLPFSVAGTYGGNTACVEIETPEEDQFLLCDLGCGAREFGLSALARRGGRPATYHVLQSHVHWDHIMGFPFLTPAYIPGNRVCIYGCHEELAEAFLRQQSAPCFPVNLDQLGADIEYHQLQPDSEYRICGHQVRAIRQHHGNVSYGYRISRDGKTLVYSTDSEHKLEDYQETSRFVAFFQDADLVIFDAQYSLAESVSVKEDWGHSSNMVGVELCQMAGAAHLALFHHEPTFSDHQLDEILAETRRLEEITRADRPLRVSAVHDGLVIEL